MAIPKQYVDPSDVSAALFADSSVENAVTAAVASTQAGGYPITAAVTRVTTVGTTGDSLLLPAAVAGEKRTVFNKGANSMDVFPASGDAINALSADAAYAVAATKGVIFHCVVTGTWDTILTA